MQSVESFGLEIPASTFYFEAGNMLFRSTSPVSGIPNCTLVYRSEEYSFDTLPVPLSGGSSILVNDLNLELDERNRIISNWGTCPHPKWKSVLLSPPPAVSGGSIGNRRKLT